MGESCPLRAILRLFLWDLHSKMMILSAGGLGHGWIVDISSSGDSNSPDKPDVLKGDLVYIRTSFRVFNSHNCSIYHCALNSEAICEAICIK